MYRHCIFCSANLKSNDAVERFPFGGARPRRGSGMALENTRTRLQQLYGERAELRAFGGSGAGDLGGGWSRSRFRSAPLPPAVDGARETEYSCWSRLLGTEGSNETPETMTIQCATWCMCMCCHAGASHGEGAVGRACTPGAMS
jgi:hypothetical protein